MKMLLAAAATSAVLLAVGHSSISVAQEKKPAVAKSKCNAITEEQTCKADTTCSWIAASVDPATKQVKRKAYCRTKAAGKKAATTTPKEPAAKK
jgi:hypothetical protein